MFAPCAQRRCAVSLLVLLSACGGGGGGSSSGPAVGAGAGGSTTPAASYAIGGSVAGLLGQGLTLQLNDGSPLPVGADGSFRFVDAVASGSNYRVQVKSQPQSPSQTCTVSGGGATGTVGSQDITNVSVSCATNSYNVGGEVRGLSAPAVVLQLNGTEDLEVGADGKFKFTGPLASGSAYRVTVKTQPNRPPMVCDVGNASGVVSSSEVADVSVTCAHTSGALGYAVSNGFSLLNVDTINGQYGVVVGADSAVTGFTTSSLKGPSFSADGRAAFMAGPSNVFPYPATLNLIRVETTARTAKRVTSLTIASGMPSGVIAHPAGQYVFTPEPAGVIRTYKADVATGTLAQVGEVQTTLTGGDGGLVDAAGRFLYVKSPDGSIAVLRINATDGALSVLQTVRPFINPSRLRMASHPSGRFLYVLKGGGTAQAPLHGEIVTLAVDRQTGLLSQVGSTSDMGINSGELVVHPFGRHLYVLSAGHREDGPSAPEVVSALTILAIDGVTGLPSRQLPDILGEFPGASCLSVHPKGTYVYADVAMPPDGSTRAIRQLAFNPTTGGLDLAIYHLNKPCPKFWEWG